MKIKFGTTDREIQNVDQIDVEKLKMKQTLIMSKALEIIIRTRPSY